MNMKGYQSFVLSVTDMATTVGIAVRTLRMGSLEEKRFQEQTANEEMYM